MAVSEMKSTGFAVQAKVFLRLQPLIIGILRCAQDATMMNGAQVPDVAPGKSKRTISAPSALSWT
jgi:hypothetical protein